MSTGVLFDPPSGRNVEAHQFTEEDKGVLASTHPAAGDPKS
jgi:hypothetical protein